MQLTIRSILEKTDCGKQLIGKLESGRMNNNSRNDLLALIKADGEREGYGSLINDRRLLATKLVEEFPKEKPVEVIF